MRTAGAREPLDRDRGLVLLAWFVIATAVLVGVVLIVAEVDAMWILVPAVGLHLTLTFVVLAAIFRLMDDSGGSP